MDHLGFDLFHPHVNVIIVVEFVGHLVVLGCLLPVAQPVVGPAPPLVPLGGVRVQLDRPAAILDGCVGLLQLDKDATESMGRQRDQTRSKSTSRNN